MEFRYEGNSLKSGIYYITNITDGKVYIGSAKCFKKRGYQHLRELEKGTHKNPELQHAFTAHGTDAFVFTVEELVEGDKLARTTAEQRHLDMFLDKWDRVYNHAKNTVQVQGPWSSTPEETRKRMSESAKNFWQLATPERKQKVADEARQRWKSEEYRQRVYSMRGKTHTEASRKRTSAALYKRRGLHTKELAQYKLNELTTRFIILEYTLGWAGTSILYDVVSGVTFHYRVRKLLKYLQTNRDFHPRCCY